MSKRSASRLNRTAQIPPPLVPFHFAGRGGKVYRAMESYCQQHTATFFFNRPFYADGIAQPSILEMSLLTRLIVDRTLRELTGRITTGVIREGTCACFSSRNANARLSPCPASRPKNRLAKKRSAVLSTNTDSYFRNGLPNYSRAKPRRSGKSPRPNFPFRCYPMPCSVGWVSWFRIASDHGLFRINNLS